MIDTDQVRRTARSVLIEWANGQDAWVREIVGEVLATRREVANAALLRVKEIYLAEKQLSGGAMPDVPLLGDGSVADGGAEQLRLTSLMSCRGVNALAEDNEIIFNPRMTV